MNSRLYSQTSSLYSNFRNLTNVRPPIVYTKTIDAENRELDETLNGLEEENSKYEADMSQLETTQREQTTKLELSRVKFATIQREQAEFQSKILMAENERSTLKNIIKDLEKTISNLMWKGKRVTTAEANGRLIIPNIRITKTDQALLRKASEVSKTSYYALVADDTLDFSERSVTTDPTAVFSGHTGEKNAIKIISAPNKYTTHFMVPGTVSSVSSTAGTKLGKGTTSARDDNSTILTYESNKGRDSPDPLTLKPRLHLSPKTYRNSVSVKDIKPYPSFTQPRVWGQNSAAVASPNCYDYTLEFGYNAPYHSNSMSVPESFHGGISTSSM